MEHMEHTHGVHCYAKRTWTYTHKDLTWTFMDFIAMNYPWKSNEIFFITYEKHMKIFFMHFSLDFHGYFIAMKSMKNHFIL